MRSALYIFWNQIQGLWCANMGYRRKVYGFIRLAFSRVPSGKYLQQRNVPKPQNLQLCNNVFGIKTVAVFARLAVQQHHEQQHDNKKRNNDDQKPPSATVNVMQSSN
jgi:hypothetical protein